MDDIQKVLVKAGRKDLAQEYYKKISVGFRKQYQHQHWQEINRWKIF